MSGKKDAGRKHEIEDERDKKKKKSGCWLMIISSRSLPFVRTRNIAKHGLLCFFFSRGYMKKKESAPPSVLEIPG